MNLIDSMILFSLFLYDFLCFERREIKKREKNTNLASFLIKMDNKTLTELISGG